MLVARIALDPFSLGLIETLLQIPRRRMTTMMMMKNLQASSEHLEIDGPSAMVQLCLEAAGMARVGNGNDASQRAAVSIESCQHILAPVLACLPRSAPVRAVMVIGCPEILRDTLGSVIG